MNKAQLDQIIKREAEKHVENCDNQSGSFLQRDLEKIRTKSITAGASLLAEPLLLAIEALEKIADPRKRHKEPDKYTEVGCIMNISDQALQRIEEMLGGGK